TLARIGDKLSADQIYIVIKLTRVMLLAQIFFTVSNIMTGILQSYKRFIVPSLAPVIYNLGIILGVVLFSGKFGIYSAGLGVILGAFMHMIVQIPLVLKLGFKPTFSLNIMHPGVIKLFLLSSTPTTASIIHTQSGCFLNSSIKSVILPSDS
ncbi:MAG: hypothetical protein KBD78_14885, partial [Oligoflexales bacterium]|nr:hypothetical protein [Oligoflexales bacterium]